MRLGRLVLAAAVFLAAGFWMIVNYCHGATAFSVGMPVDQSTLHIDLTTIGIAVVVGVPLVAIGAALLALSVIGSIVVQFLSGPHAYRNRRKPEENEEYDEERAPSRGFLSLNG